MVSCRLPAGHKGHHPALADSRRLWPELLRLGEASELAWCCRDPEFFAETMPSVTLERSPSGLPIASVRSPTST